MAQYDNNIKWLSVAYHVAENGPWDNTRAMITTYDGTFNLYVYRECGFHETSIRRDSFPTLAEAMRECEGYTPISFSMETPSEDFYWIPEHPLQVSPKNFG